MLFGVTYNIHENTDNSCHFPASIRSISCFYWTYKNVNERKHAALCDWGTRPPPPPPASFSTHTHTRTYSNTQMHIRSGFAPAATALVKLLHCTDRTTARYTSRHKQQECWQAFLCLRQRNPVPFWLLFPRREGKGMHDDNLYLCSNISDIRWRERDVMIKVVVDGGE